MKIAYRLILTSLIFCSCSMSKDISNNTFKYKSKRRAMQLVFENDTICRLVNIFHCNDIDSEVKKLTTTCTYRRNGDTIFVRNINCKSDDCNYDLMWDIPIQESKKCGFLNLANRSSEKTIGPNYLTDYQKYGIVPNIDIDTLYIIKNKIFLNKQNEEMRISFLFK